MVVALAVRLAAMLEEVARAELLLALLTHEVLRMPDPTQRCDDLPRS